MKYILILFLYFNIATSHCYYVDCSSVVQSTEQQTETEIKKEYDKTNAELQKVISEYKNKIEKLKELKKELKIEVKLKKEQLLENEKLIFLLKQFNKINSLNSDIKANE